MLAQSGERQRSGKRRLREGKRTAANRRSALRKCRNAVSAGVLSPISSAVGKNGAVGDKRNARAGARNSPLRRGRGALRRCAATPHPPPSGAPVSLRVGRSADLTRHRRVIQRRGPPGRRLLGCGIQHREHPGGKLEGAAGVQRKFTVFLQNLKVELRKASML